MVSPLMRRGLEIRVAFRPTRLSTEHLRTAYEIATPMSERRISRRDDEPVRDVEHGLDAAADVQRGTAR
jgi:hypothetical protein